MKSFYSLAIILLLVTTLFPRVLHAQISNYDGNGHKIKSASEVVRVLVDTVPSAAFTGSTVHQQAAGILSTLAGTAISAGVKGVQAYLKKREASFTGQYDGLGTGSGFYRNDTFNIQHINIIRKLHSQDTYYASKIVLTPVVTNRLFRLKVESVDLNLAKARIKFSTDTLKLSITIEITGKWLDVESATSNRTVVKSQSLGKYSIDLDEIAVGKINHPAEIYSDWFQLLPTALTSQHIGSVGYYSVVVTVKEANPRGIKSEKMQTFFANNGDDITAVFKALLGK